MIKKIAVTLVLLTSIANAYNIQYLSRDGYTAGSIVNGSITNPKLVTGSFTAITSVGKLTNLSVSGNAIVSGTLRSIGNITGTLATATQSNIISVGTLSALAIGGNLSVDTNTLFVDSANNRVGIGTASPQNQLQLTQNEASDWITKPSMYFNNIANSGSGTKIYQGDSGAIFFIGSNGTPTTWTGVFPANVTTDVIGRTFMGLGVYQSSTLASSRFGIVSAPAGTAQITSELFTVLANGYVGIGTTSPSQILSIIKASGSPTVLIGNDTTHNATLQYADTNVFNIDTYSYTYPISIQGGTVYVQGGATRNVGIGTTSPATTLDVNGSARIVSGINVGTASGAPTGGINLATTGTGGPHIELNASETGAGKWTIVAGASNNPCGAGALGIYDNDSSKYRFVIKDTGNVGIGTTSPSQILSIIKASGSPTVLIGNDTTHNATLQYADTNVFNIDTYSYTYPISIQGGTVYVQGGANRNVGIGINSPEMPLDIQSNTNAEALQIRGRSVDNVSEFWFANNDGANKFVLQAWPNSNYLEIKPNGQTSISIRSENGNVGIGTTSPDAKLHVTGDVEVDAANAFYMGAVATDGTWRIVRSGNNLLMQRRESGNFVTKSTITP